MTSEPEEATLTPRQVIGLLYSAFDARNARDKAAKHYDALAKTIKDYMLGASESLLTEGEHGIEAKLQTRQLAGRYVLDRAPAELIERLHGIGALTVDLKVIAAFKGKSMAALDAEPYFVPGGETYALLIERVKE